MTGRPTRHLGRLPYRGEGAGDDHEILDQPERVGGRRVALEDTLGLGRRPSVDVEAVDLALRRLAGIDPRLSRVVELRFFAGLTIEETAEVVGVSAPTVKREWAAARAWLRRELRTPDED